MICTYAIGGENVSGSDALVKTKNKPAMTSLREIAAGKVHFNRNTHEVVNEWVRQQHALNANK